MIYGKRSNGKHHGLVITKPLVVDFMLDRIGYVPIADLSKIRIIEPAAGDGAFAIAIIERLAESSQIHNFSFQKALSNIKLFEIDPFMTSSLTERINSRLQEFSVIIPDGMIQEEDFLLAELNSCDIVIGNPPYVRHENIPEEKKKLYRKLFKTFTHRSDLYIPFYEKGLNTLNSNGTLSFICSNRWLKNQYGLKLRELIKFRFSMREVIDLEKVNPFEEEVIAYPAITTVLKSPDRTGEQYYQIEDIAELTDYKVKPKRILNTNNPSNWFSYEANETSHERFLDSIENQGFKIGIGVATGADKVFIGKNLVSMVEQELLLPILTARDVKNNHFKWSGNYVINPFDHQGGLIDLGKYPRAKKYFEEKSDLLKKRHVAKKNPRSWYKTIDKINSQLIGKNKIILPDISGNSHLFIDSGEYYPHHNLYYITGHNHEKLVLLAAILMSDFVRDQLCELGNKMNGGYPRWQSQNLKKLRVPVIEAIPEEVALKISAAYENRDHEQINSLINEEEISKFSLDLGQLKLFEPKPEAYKTNNYSMESLQ